MRHIRDPAFVPLFDALPADVQALARKNFALLKTDSKHPSLHFKRIRDDIWRCAWAASTCACHRGHRPLPVVLDWHACGVQQARSLREAMGGGRIVAQGTLEDVA
jgi:hypothetical protein